jgi:uncharacterized protein (TIGR04222 family)
MNPLDLSGPEFLSFYVAVLGASAGVALVLRWLLRLPSAEPGEDVPELTPYEAAYLGGGPDLAVHAAIANLAHRRVLAVQPVERKVSVQDLLPSGAHRLERRIYHAAGEGETISQVRADASTVVDKLRKRLQEDGLILADERATVIRFFSGLLLALVTLLGLAKIVVGLERGRPVGFLVALTFVSLGVAIVFFTKRPLRSRRGDQVLARLQEQNAALRSAAGSRPEQLAAEDLVLALGLFGMGIIATGPVADVRTAVQPSPGSGGGGWVTGCGSGCGGGCGGGGCGGCGA